MRLWKVILLIFIAVISITACRKPSDEEIYYDAHKKMMKIQSYEVVAKITSYTGGNKREYKFNQMFMYPDKYRLEVISPDSIKGNLTIFNGKAAWIQHSAINQTLKMDNFDKSKEQLMFIGYFLENFINSEDTAYSSEVLNGEDSIVITTELPGSSPHFYKQKLWITKEDFTPIQLNIVDNQDRVKFEVNYEDFKINPSLDEKLFYLD